MQRSRAAARLTAEARPSGRAGRHAIRCNHHEPRALAPEFCQPRFLGCRQHFGARRRLAGCVSGAEEDRLAWPGADIECGAGFGRLCHAKPTRQRRFAFGNLRVNRAQLCLRRPHAGLMRGRAGGKGQQTGKKNKTHGQSHW